MFHCTGICGDSIAETIRCTGHSPTLNGAVMLLNDFLLNCVREPVNAPKNPFSLFWEVAGTFQHKLIQNAIKAAVTLKSHPLLYLASGLGHHSLGVLLLFWSFQGISG